MSLNRRQALDLFASDDLIGLGMEAATVRRTLHPEGVVTYLVDRPLLCTGAHLEAEITAAVDCGATALRLSPATATLAQLVALLGSIRLRWPTLHLHGLTADDVLALAHDANVDSREALLRLQAAGLGALSGTDAGILDDAVPNSPRRATAAEWLALHRLAHTLSLPSTAAMRFGAGETLDQRVAHLFALRHLEEETGGFVSFLPQAAPGDRTQEATAVEYLKTLAICRLTLDTIPHLEADWPSQGLKILQMAFRFGADDTGSTAPPPTGIAFDGTTEEDLRRVIRGAGFRPVIRDALFRTCFLH